MRRAHCLIALFFIAMFAQTAPARAIDPHAVFEERCSRCHEEHGGTFARKSLVLAPDGRLAGKKAAIPVEEFLIGHFGKPSQDDIAALVDMFTQQLRTGGLFKQKCRICHTSAKRLARGKLVLRDEQPVGRFSARKMGEFLARHGRLEGDEIETMRAMLEWQLRTATD